MRVLLDGNLPADLVTLLVGHQAQTIHQRRWSDLNNGALLDAAAGEYDAFMTMDQSLRFQQNLKGRSIAILLIHARSNRIEDLAPLAPAILAALPTAQRGEVTSVGA